MPAARFTTNTSGQLRFSLAALMEFFTVCAILAAFSVQVGIAAVVCLTLMALALAARRGLLAIYMFGVVSVAADVPFESGLDAGVMRQLTALLIAGALCAWYCVLRAKVQSVRAGW
jgi:hypothetical protein